MDDRILVPVDDSPQSWDAFEYALETFPDAEIVALHVVDPVHTVLEGEVYGDESRRAEAEAENITSEARQIATAFDAEVSTAVERGRPARVIVEYTDDHDIDHVVMGSHGRTGVSRVLLGSVSETVVRRSDARVTVCR